MKRTLREDFKVAYGMIKKRVRPAPKGPAPLSFAVVPEQYRPRAEVIKRRVSRRAGRLQRRLKKASGRR